MIVSSLDCCMSCREALPIHTPLTGRAMRSLLTPNMLTVGLFAAVLIPGSPTSTVSWFRGTSGWLTPREEKIMFNRIMREDPSKSSMHNCEPLTPPYSCTTQRTTTYGLCISPD
ncbi:hypothetical protein BJ878DRAFT_487172 [Calycina marina]|uniref:Uncharacterized protein n=1 Tax=Calycina marina TaxID=1763456 RepID=A0A9P7ZBH8_9HELO|nr:hypothetical protein BJ878DRAFT_487172 [Calycina marina]